MDNKERFIEIFTSQIHRPGAAELLEWLERTDFFEAPASTHYHGSYPGGLVEHSLNVYYELIGAGRVPGVPTAETYAVVALLHDICKADFYAQSTRNQKNSDGEWETVPCYTVREKFPFGHGEKSAFLAQRFGWRAWTSCFLLCSAIRRSQGTRRNFRRRSIKSRGAKKTSG